MTEQDLQADLGLKDLVRIYLSHWRLFCSLFGVLLIFAVAYYLTSVDFVATSRVLANDSQNSSLQAFSSQFFGLSKSVEESKKGSSLLTKHVEYLKTQRFLDQLIVRLQAKKNSPDMTIQEKQALENLRPQFLDESSKNQLKAQFAQWLKFSISSEFEVKVQALTPDRNLSLLLSKSAADLSVDALKEREKKELKAVESFVAEQKMDSEKKLEVFSHQVAALELDESQLLPLASKEKMGEYVSELLVRASEIKLKIRENRKTIEYLETSRTSQRESALYGVGGRIESLRIENRLLQGRLEQVENSMVQIKSEAKTLPYAAQMLEDLKKKSNLEFERYKEFDTVLNKLEAQKVSVETRFDILEPARFESTLPQVSLMTLILAALLFSQLASSLIVYFRFLWNPETITAQASRNLVIFDNHSADPRFIFENSKIRFSLKKPEDKAAASLEGPTSIKNLNVFKTQTSPEGSSPI